MTAVAETPAATLENTSCWALPIVPMRRSLKFVVFAFLLSRVLILTVWIGAQFFMPDTNALAQMPGMTFEPQLQLSPGLVQRTLSKLAILNDAGWYATIAERGYDPGPFSVEQQRNWPFFPLHPLLWRAAAQISGHFIGAGLVLVNLCFFLALLVLHRIALTFADGAASTSLASADRAVLIMALFPTSYFFSLPWTESLFVLITASSFLAAVRERWWLACLLGLAATATRVTGLFVLPMLLLWFWQQRARVPWFAWCALVLVPFGLLAFMWHLDQVTGDALAFSHIQPAFARSPLPLGDLLAGMLESPDAVIRGWNPRYLNFAAILLGFAASAWLAWRRQLGLAAFLVLGLLAPLATGTVMSGTRYAMGLFPIYLALAAWTTRRGIEIAWVAASAGALTVMAGLFAMGINFAGA